MKLPHLIHVSIYSGHPILGLLHDSAEDGYFPLWALRFWPALDAITRRKTETYREYIERVATNPKARRVKLCDLRHNMSRNGGAKPSLMKRYTAALERLTSKQNAPKL